jgi:phosphate transport system protein
MHIHKEIEKLKQRILTLSNMVTEDVHEALIAIETRDEAMARRVVKMDVEIDQMEVEIEEDCLKILALHQPVAVDLRMIIAILKMNNDLERIGDLASNIAERAIYLISKDPIDIPFDLRKMSDIVEAMLKQSLEAMVNLDTELARQVCLQDEAVDTMHREMYERVESAMHSRPQEISCLIPMLTVARHLERIADHATNIAEDVLYLVEGRIIRHESPDYWPEPLDSRR